MSIVLRFVSHSSLVSHAISIFERDGWATHVEAVDKSGWLGSQAPAGVLTRPVGYDKGEVVREQFIELTDATEEQSEKFYKFLTAQIGKPYDYIALAGLALGRDWRAGKSWFCSELIAAALEHAGYWKLASDTNHVTPRDLYLILSGRLNFKDK